MRETYYNHGSFWYKTGDPKHTYTRKTCSCGKRFSARRDKPGLFCSVLCAQSREHNTMWKGASAGYMALHGRIYRELGKASSCLWGHVGPYEWAHNTGDQGDVSEYVSMCIPCHRQFDQAIAKCLDKKCKRGHTLNNSTMYVKVRDGRELRQCKQCAKDRARNQREALPS